MEQAGFSRAASRGALAQMAEAFAATLLLFNAECAPALAADARARGVAVRRHEVIYRLVADVKDEISARIPLVQEEEVLGA